MTVKKNFKGVVEYELQQPDGTQAAFLNDVIQVRPGKAVTSKDKITLKSPLLWSPETPTLYNPIVRIRDNEGNVGRLPPPYRYPQRRIQRQGRILAERQTLSKPADWRQPPSGFCRSRQCRCQQHSLARR